MAAFRKLDARTIRLGLDSVCSAYSRSYGSRVNWRELRPMIRKRIERRATDYPFRGMIPVANEVLKIRAEVRAGVSALLKSVPVKSCKYCPEVYIGEIGHQIRTCHGFRRITKDQEHQWTNGGLNDILVPVEAFHLNNMFQNIIKHDERFDFDRIPAVVELCCQAGADISYESMHASKKTEDNDAAISLSPDVIRSIAQRTLVAWDALKLNVQKLLLVYPSKVCKHCSEVHIGPSGHRARQCGVFKYERWRAYHFWEKAGVDDLVPPKMVWHRRPQDPQILLDSGRGFYGHAPAVVEICAQAGAVVPTKYFCMMKMHGLTGMS